MSVPAVMMSAKNHIMQINIKKVSDPLKKSADSTMIGAVFNCIIYP